MPLYPKTRTPTILSLLKTLYCIALHNEVSFIKDSRWQTHCQCKVCGRRWIISLIKLMPDDYHWIDTGEFITYPPISDEPSHRIKSSS